jgi:hypothetical protein
MIPGYTAWESNKKKALTIVTNLLPQKECKTHKKYFIEKTKENKYNA